MVKRFQEKGRNFHNDKIGLQEDITILNLRASNSIVSKYTGKKKTDKKKTEKKIVRRKTIDGSAIRILLRADEQAENHQSGFKRCAVSI